MIKGPRGFLTGIRIQRKDKRYTVFLGREGFFKFVHIDNLEGLPVIGPTMLVEWLE